MKKSNSFFSRVFLVFALLFIILFCSIRVWESRRVIDWDVTQYYSYLPATFLYHDYSFGDTDTLWRKAHFKYILMEGDTMPVKMTAGMAYLYSPFFLGAHVYAKVSGYPANAFSTPYQVGLMLSLLGFALAGFWFLGKFLMLFFTQKVAAITALLFFLGTNLTYYCFAEAMSHAYSFALVGFLFYNSIRHLRAPSVWGAVLVAFSAALLVFIRPSNIVILLFPLLLALFLKKRATWPKIARHLPVMLLTGFVVILPQLFYWKEMTGHWLYYSYGEERFFFTDPEIWKGLFSYRKGWLIYSPLLFFAFAGFYFLFKTYSKIAMAALITLAAGLWVVFSWWCWWYGGGFGARALIEYLPLMALPLAALIKWLIRQRWWLQAPVFLLFGYLCFSSLFMSSQYYRGIIHHDGMGKELFWRQYLKNHYIKEYGQYLEQPDYDAAFRNED